MANHTVTYFKRLQRPIRGGKAGLKREVASLLAREIRPISADEFGDLTLTEVLDPDADRPLYGKLDDVSPKTLRGLPSYLASLYTVPLMSPYGERFLFRKLNYLLHWAAVIRERLRRSPDNRTLAETLAGMLDEADQTRSRVTQCNLRLVVSIARRFSDNRNGFEELVSEGNLILMKAVDRFDYSRGFRFSTYATHAVQRHIFRLFQVRQRRRSREQLTADEILGDLMPPDQPAIVIDDAGKEVRSLLGQWDDCLDEREQYVIGARFGIDGHADARTLRDLSDELGVSKERIRQVQIRAMEKLREFVEDRKVGLEFKPLPLN